MRYFIVFYSAQSEAGFIEGFCSIEQNRFPSAVALEKRIISETQAEICAVRNIMELNEQDYKDFNDII